MSKPETFLITAGLSLLLAAGCSGETESTVRIIRPARTVAVAVQGPVDEAGGIGLQIRGAGAFASYLVDGDGRTVYLFTPDADSEASSCTDVCAEAWPPVITSGDPVAIQPAVDDDLISTITRDDGSLQVTYDQWPIYYFAKDVEPGDAGGHGIESFGGEWYLISPEGDAIEERIESY